MEIGSLDRVKMWHESFKNDLRNLKDMKGFIANCNIDWLISKVDSLTKEIERLNAEKETNQ